MTKQELAKIKHERADRLSGAMERLSEIYTINETAVLCVGHGIGWRDCLETLEMFGILTSEQVKELESDPYDD